MKHFFSCVVLFLIVIIILFGIDITSRYRELEVRIQIMEIQEGQKVQELEKEIRLLKTDISIMENGFENE